MLLAVSTISQDCAESVIQPGLSGLIPGLTRSFTPETFAATEEAALSSMLSRSQIFSVPGIVLFPNVPQATLNRIQKLRPARFTYWGKEGLVGDNLARHISDMARHPLDPSQVERLRQAYSPEVVVHRAMAPRRRSLSEIAQGLSDYLLDYDQEHAIKADLALSDEAEATLDASHARLITGVAGSGKTLVLLHRAALNAQLHPGKRTIILTHNKPLIADLRRRLALLAPEPGAECIHFLSWATRQLREDIEILHGTQLQEIVREAIAAIPELRGFPIAFLVDEFAWLKDYDVESLGRYLRAKRIGRGRRLNELQRRRLFDAFIRYERILADRQCDDWSGLPLRLWRKVQTGQIVLPTYDYVFVDEAQFFAPTWLKLVRALVKRESGQLLLAADPTQGFLKRRESWAASGLKVRGRTIRLQRAYRNTRSIIEHAANFYRQRLPDEDEDINLPDQDQICRLSEGPPPQYLSVTSLQDEITHTCTQVRKALAGGARPQDILVIACDSQRVRLVVERLNEGGTKPIAADAQKEDAKNLQGRIRVCSLNAATGLEAPIVLLLGSAQMLEQEQSFTLSAEDRHDLRRDNTRKLYMAFTRATDRLVVFSRRVAN